MLPLEMIVLHFTVKMIYVTPVSRPATGQIQVFPGSLCQGSSSKSCREFTGTAVGEYVPVYSEMYLHVKYKLHPVFLCHVHIETIELQNRVSERSCICLHLYCILRKRTQKIAKTDLKKGFNMFFCQALQSPIKIGKRSLLL